MESNHSSKTEVEKRGNWVLPRLRDPFWPSIIISSVWILALLPWGSLCLSFLQILALEDFNAPFKKKTYITSPHGHRENLESKTWKHVSTYPHRMKNQMSNTMNSYFIINFLNVCALVLIRARKIKNKQTFFSLLREWLGHFQDFSPILRIWNVLKMEYKHLLQVQKCGSWGFTKWTPYCKMCKKITCGQCCENEYRSLGTHLCCLSRAPTFSIFFFFWDLAYEKCNSYSNIVPFIGNTRNSNRLTLKEENACFVKQFAVVIFFLKITKSESFEILVYASTDI